VVPPGVTSAIGLDLFHAYLVYDAAGFYLGSNAARMSIVK
jgi:hypothetical protein